MCDRGKERTARSGVRRPYRSHRKTSILGSAKTAGHVRADSWLESYLAHKSTLTQNYLLDNEP